MRALITGAEGFVGSQLAKQLRLQGEMVAGTFRNKPEMHQDIELFELDILDKDRMKQIFEQFKPDKVFHLAALSHVGDAEGQAATYDVNVRGTSNVIEVSEGLDKSPAILFTSTAQVYGTPISTPIAEDHPLNPPNDYAKSKLEAEKICEASARRGFRVITMRAFNHFGPGQSDSFVVSSFAKQIAEIETGKKEPIIHVGNLEPKRDFTDVRDIARAYSLALDMCESGIYNVSSGKAHSIQEILDMLLQHSEAKIDIIKDPSRLRKNDIPLLVGDFSNFKDKTRWSPLFDLENSLLDTLNYWREKKR